MFLGPQPSVSERELERGLRDLMWDSASATAVGTLAGGVLLVSFALWLGASNAVIGLIAALPFWTQILQAPAVALVERTRARRRISILALFVARLSLPVMAVLPFLADRDLAIALLLATQVVLLGLGAVTACAWNSWMRDLVPEERLGRFFARRTVWATTVAVACNIGAGLLLERLRDLDDARPGSGVVYAGLFAVAFLASLFSTWRLSRVPEPVMPPPAARTRLVDLLRAPLKDQNFRRLIVFLSSWQFAVNLAAPFFTVYMLRQLGFGTGFVLALTVVSQLANLAVLRAWGGISDRFSNKAALGLSAPLFIACIALTPIASQFDDRYASGAYLVALHVVMGVASAGVGLASGAVALKLAPKGSATAYVAANSLISSAAAGVAPVIGGLFADFFARRRLSLDLTYTNPSGATDLIALQIGHWEFYFLFAALFGLYALHRLTLIREEGEVEKTEVVHQVLTQARRSIFNASTVAGLRLAAAFPAGMLIEQRRARRRAEEGPRRPESARTRKRG